MINKNCLGSDNDNFSERKFFKVFYVGLVSFECCHDPKKIFQPTNIKDKLFRIFLNKKL